MPNADSWPLTKAGAAAWGGRLWAEDYFAPLRAFVQRADANFFPIWKGLLQQDGDTIAAWSAVAKFDRGHICLSADFALFGTAGKENPPVVGELVVEAAIVFPSSKSKRDRAQARAEAAWENCLVGPAELVTESRLRHYPNTVRWHRPGITLYDDTTGGSIEPLGVWTVARTGPSPMALGPSAIGSTLKLARRDLPDLLDRFAHTVELLRGAVYCDRKSVDRASVIGWCGEYAFCASRRPLIPGLIWVAALRNSFDFACPVCVYEIKATTDDAEGRAHFSAAEVKELFERKRGYRVVCARIPEKIVDGIITALTSAPANPGGHRRVPPRHAEALAHLALSTGVGHERAVAAYPHCLPFIESLASLPPAAFREVEQPLDWLAPVAKELLERGAGIDVLFDRI